MKIDFTTNNLLIPYKPENIGPKDIVIHIPIFLFPYSHPPYVRSSKLNLGLSKTLIEALKIIVGDPQKHCLRLSKSLLETLKNIV